MGSAIGDTVFSLRVRSRHASVFSDSRAWDNGGERVKMVRHNWPVRESRTATQKEATMQVSEVMSPMVQLASAEDTVLAVSRSMADIDVGAIPVGDNGRLVGMITDRSTA